LACPLFCGCKEGWPAFQIWLLEGRLGTARRLLNVALGSLTGFTLHPAVLFSAYLPKPRYRLPKVTFKISCKVTAWQVEGERRMCNQQCSPAPHGGVGKGNTPADFRKERRLFAELSMRIHTFLRLQEYVLQDNPAPHRLSQLCQECWSGTTAIKTLCCYGFPKDFPQGFRNLFFKDNAEIDVDIIPHLARPGHTAADCVPKIWMQDDTHRFTWRYSLP